MGKTKPTVVPAWIPDNTTNIVDPGAKATDGYEFNDPVPSGWLNYHLNKLGQWSEYLDRMVATTLTVNDATGNDTTGNGSSTSPYKTANKAFTECAENATTIISFTDAAPTTHVMSADVTLKNQTIVLLHSGNSTLQHNINSAGATNEIYGFDMWNSSVVSTIPHTMANPALAKNWGSNDAIFRAQAGRNYFISSAAVSMNTNQAASTTCYIASTSQYGTIDLYFTKIAAGQVTTNSNGGTIKNYVKNLFIGGETLYGYNDDATIDDADYWIETQSYRNPQYTFNFKENASYASGLRKTAGGGPEAVTIKAFRGVSGADGTSGTTADGSDAEWEQKLESAPSNYAAVTGAGAMTGQLTEWSVTKTIAGNFVESALFEMTSGGYAGSKFEANGPMSTPNCPFYIHVAYTGVADTCDFYPYITQYGERNPGLITNLPSLK